ncbi:MAG TPA: YihY/virulence factor BrkB family protein [Steroidobacteraceae bacterium]|nr:YihY/virulence factor BrkB family protein [Steroidobacteraceae bacterium]
MGRRAASIAWMLADTAKTASRQQRLTSLWPMFKSTVNNWLSDQASSISAALAFYSAFSLAPLLVIAVAVIGWIVGAQSAGTFVDQQLQALFGATTAKLVVQAMHSAQKTRGIWATIVSVVTLIVGASTVFGALESALRQVWGTGIEQSTGWRGFVRTRIVSFGFILAVGFLLLVSLTMTTAISGLRGWVANRYEGMVAVLGMVEFVLSTALGTGLIALMYRYLPAVRLAWRHVLVGALVTTLLFQAGRWGIGLYLGRATQPSTFGAAASFAALLLWLYYSAQIFLLGAEFTAVLGGTRVEKRNEAPVRSR